MLPLIRFLEEMTGIKQMSLERRLNVLIYLNLYWKADCRGAFEVWTGDMQNQIAAYPPVMHPFAEKVARKLKLV